MNPEAKTYLSPLKEFAEANSLKWIDGNKLWVQQYPFDSWTHPFFSDTTIDIATANRLKESFDRRDKGSKYFSDYEHGLDPAKGNKASGEIVELKVIEEPRGVFTKAGLWGLVQFNDIAAQEIKNGEWNYWSASHYDTWTHPQTKETKELVFDGGGLTNKPYVKGMAPLNFSELGIKETEVKNADYQEFTDPGGAPNPLINNDDNDEGNRQDPIPPAEDGSVPDRSKTVVNNEGGENSDMELEKRLREALGLAEDADIIKAVTEMYAEVTPLRDALRTHNERKSFSELFPDEFARMEALEKKNKETEAKQFAESYTTHRLTKKEGDDDKETTLGYSALVIDNIATFAKKFSENNVTMDDFKTVLDSITHDGIVDYGNHGSSREDKNVLENTDEPKRGTVLERRKAFSEKVTEIMTKDELDLEHALIEAAKQYPKLAEDYRTAGVAE